MKLPSLLIHRRFVYLLLGIALLLLLGVNFWSWFFLRTMEKQILQQLQQQLQYIGKISAQTLAAQSLAGYNWANLQPGEETSPTALFLQNLLWEIKQNGDLENVLLLRPDGTVLVDQRVDFRIGQPPLIHINDSLFTRALLGEAPPPELVHFEEQYFLTCYTPVRDELGEVSAVLVLEAPAHFFHNLRRFQNLLLSMAGAAVGGIVLFGSIIVVALRRLLEHERRLQQQERLATLGQMAAMVAHEIRNPLSIMKGTVEVLRKKYGHEKDEMLEFIPEEIDRLNRLVSEFLQFARQRELRLQPCQVHQLIEEVVKPIGDSRIQCQLQASTDLLRLDPDAFRQIMLNVLENARNAVGPNGQIVIRTAVVRGGGRKFRLEIKDNGRGMEPEELKRIFEPFFTTRQTGSGLGMTITRQLVEQMGGTIRVESKSGQGTSVTIEWPL